MVDLIFANKPFGLRYDTVNQIWSIVFESNLNPYSPFSLGKQGDATNKAQDTSWLLLFTTDNEFYTVTSRKLRYIFESDQQLRFYFDSNTKIYDSRSNAIVKDIINIFVLEALGSRESNITKNGKNIVKSVGCKNTLNATLEPRSNNGLFITLVKLLDLTKRST